MTVRVPDLRETGLTIDIVRGPPAVKIVERWKATRPCAPTPWSGWTELTTRCSTEQIENYLPSC